MASGKSFALGLPLSEAEGIQAGFIKGRVNPTRSMIQVNQPLSPDPEWICSSEDVVTLALQCATHWDGLAHVSYGGRIYNGYPAVIGRSRRSQPVRHPPTGHGGQPRRPARCGPGPRDRRAGARLRHHAG